MTKTIVAVIISIFIFLSSVCSPMQKKSAVIDNVPTYPAEIFYNQIFTEEDYLSLVVAGENNLKISDKAYTIDGYWLAVESAHSLFAMQNSKGAILLLSGKDFCITESEIWYTSIDGTVKSFNYQDANFNSLEPGTLLNPDSIDIDELLDE